MQQLVSNEPFCPARLSFHWSLWKKRRWKWKSDEIYPDETVQGERSKTEAPKTVKQGGQHSGSGSIQNPLETEVVYAKQSITIHEYNSPTLNILIWSLPVCSAHSSSWSFSTLPRSPNIKTHWRLLLSTLSVVFYVFPVWNHTSRSFICTWPWNTASIFFSLTLPLQRFLGAHVKRLSADIYLRHWGARRYLRGPRPSRCVEGVPDTPAFVVVMAAAKQDAAMLFVVVTAHSFFSPHICPHITWPTSEEHLVHSDRAAAIRGSVHGILLGWDMIKCPGAECWWCCFFSARSSSAETDRFYVQRVTWGTD